MSKIFVIAGTREEANEWIKGNLTKRQNAGETTLSWSDYVIVNDPLKLRGTRDPHGVFVGNWLGRPDILEIVEDLMIASSHVNPALGKIYKDLKPMVRPTPKVRTVQDAIDDAAKRMAEEIDREVIQQTIANLI